MQNTERTMAIAVDLGGTTTRVRLVQTAPKQDVPPRILGGATFDTEQSYAAQMARLSAVVAELLDADPCSEGAMTGIGVSLGGRIAEDGRSVSVAPNLRDYERRPFVADLSARCGGLPVRLAHDAVCGLLAERLVGALHGSSRCAYLTLSTGTGCAIHLESPAAGGAGVTLSIELGHQLLDHNTRVCLCGQVGCLETYTGGRQLALRYGQPIETLDDASSSEMWREFAEKLSGGLVNLAHLTRVERVAIGGAIALNHPSLLESLRAAVAERLRNARLELVPTALGESAPLIGAALLLTTPEGELLH
ncbi:MAG TPA: ROK family protein [Ktedonobacterales bacterium]|nr:ROK family protein [Ktedonobacterales bacterium]